ncbi:MAG: response regulator transcription factor [Candidatus Marinimicrobia bacterium]|nr:response regulator transcription factor [Candidatus Neomarinimicrobiota bacterium]
MIKPEQKAVTSTPPDACRILLVDDHAIVRRGLTTLLSQQPGFSICGAVGAYEEALSAAAAQQPDLAIVDLTLGDHNGLDLIRALRALAHPPEVLVLSMHDEEVYAERALRAGARGYVMKEQADEKICEAVRTVRTGRIYASPALAQRLMARLAEPSAAAPATGVGRLTDREMDVFVRIGRGKSTREIADELDLGARTVETHRAHIKQKLACDSAAQLVRLAVRHVEGGAVV